MNRIDTAAARVHIVNAMTIDVEDYYQVSAFDAHIDRAHWPQWPSHVEANVARLLELLAAHRVHATFFTLGWTAERHPAMVRRIVAAGHELASHGYAHERATAQTRRTFTQDVRRSKGLLEDIGGCAVHGYRAPSFSIDARNRWAHAALRDAGYRYSSSVYPVRHDHYGMPDSPRSAWRPCGDDGVLELPVSTVRLLGRNWPAGGGGYFRLLPYAASRAALRRLNRCDGQAGIFYLHPWELDTAQPRPAGLAWRTRWRHYLNLHRTAQRLAWLLDDLHWDRIDAIFPEATDACTLTNQPQVR